jgi:hypothetical protein
VSLKIKAHREQAFHNMKGFLIQWWKAANQSSMQGDVFKYKMKIFGVL